MMNDFSEKELFYTLLKKIHRGEPLSDTKIFVEKAKDGKHI
jgi:hypothetical protein|tara:strand:- start:985 stop:1107 length:123 start_codon:yes stop_codon:yes gene_type:complete